MDATPEKRANEAEATHSIADQVDLKELTLNTLSVDVENPCAIKGDDSDGRVE